MSGERLLKALDHIHSNRDAGVPLSQRTPSYLEAAGEAIKTPGVRLKSIAFVTLAARATATAAFQSTVHALAESEPKITNSIENAGNKIVGFLDTIGGTKR